MSDSERVDLDRTHVAKAARFFHKLLPGVPPREQANLSTLAVLHWRAGPDMVEDRHKRALRHMVEYRGYHLRRRNHVAGRRQGGQANRKPRLEKEYERLFQQSLPEWLNGAERPQSLRQPSPLRIVESVVTYGAYEDPI